MLAGSGSNSVSLAVLDRYQVRALRAGFTNVSSLEIAGENHMRPFVKNVGLMDMAEGPIVIALGDKIIERTGGVVGVAAQAAEAGVQHANVERACSRFRVGEDQIVGHVALAGEALTVEGDAQFLQLEGLRFFGAENVFTFSGRTRRRVIWLSASWLP